MTGQYNNSIFRFAVMEAIATLSIAKPKGVTGKHIFEYFQVCKNDHNLPIPGNWLTLMKVLMTLHEMLDHQIEVCGVDVDLSKRGSPLKRVRLTERGEKERQETEHTLAMLAAFRSLAKEKVEG